MVDEGTAHLIKMAVQITRNCGFDRDPQSAADRAAAHIRKFWTPAMIERLLAQDPDQSLELSTTLTVLKAQ